MAHRKNTWTRPKPDEANAPTATTVLLPTQPTPQYVQSGTTLVRVGAPGTLQIPPTQPAHVVHSHAQRRAPQAPWQQSLSNQAAHAFNQGCAGHAAAAQPMTWTRNSAATTGTAPAAPGPPSQPTAQISQGLPQRPQPTPQSLQPYRQLQAAFQNSQPSRQPGPRTGNMTWTPSLAAQQQQPVPAPAHTSQPGPLKQSVWRREDHDGTAAPASQPANQPPNQPVNQPANQPAVPVRFPGKPLVTPQHAAAALAGGYAKPARHQLVRLGAGQEQKRPRVWQADQSLVKRRRLSASPSAHAPQAGPSLRYKSLGKSRLVLAPRTPRTPTALRGSKVLLWLRTPASASASVASAPRSSKPRAATTTPRHSTRPAMSLSLGKGPVQQMRRTAPAQRLQKGHNQLVRLGTTTYSVIRGPNGQKQLRASAPACAAHKTPGGTATPRIRTHKSVPPPSRGGRPVLMKRSLRWSLALASSSANKRTSTSGSSLSPASSLLHASAAAAGGGASQLRWSSSLAARRISNSLQLARLKKAPARTTRPSIPCSTYCRTGRCDGQADGSCKLGHDPAKVAVCTHWLQGTCNRPDCKLQHKVCKDLMPVCSFFGKGLCGAEDCPYLHINYPPNTVVCRAFKRGYCPLGQHCTKEHSRPVVQRKRPHAAPAAPAAAATPAV